MNYRAAISPLPQDASFKYYLTSKQEGFRYEIFLLSVYTYILVCLRQISAYLNKILLNFLFYEPPLSSIG